MIDIVMPIQRQTEQFERTMGTLEQFNNTVETRLKVIERADLNVSEARQLALDDPDYSRYICYIDDDSEMVMDGWLDTMFALLQSDKSIGAVFGGEQWGTENPPAIIHVEGGQDVTPMTGGTPAACMLIDKERLDPLYHIWDQNIGLRNGWLGGDFEEVDFVYRMLHRGLRCVRDTDNVFHHTGGKSSFLAWGSKDRAVCVNTMRTLLSYKYNTGAALDDDYFKGLQYVKADCNDDCMLAPGYTLRDCYREVISRAGLSKHPQFVHVGLS